ncbi:hypothetical protein [Streptomyces noursei]|nr:hypothetical protein [Streptomyces noursei]GGX41790.1 hypothetical protein GCM10010341_74720 [Streptomyces noursei]
MIYYDTIKITEGKYHVAMTKDRSLGLSVAEHSTFEAAQKDAEVRNASQGISHSCVESLSTHAEGAFGNTFVELQIEADSLRSYIDMYRSALSFHEIMLPGSTTIDTRKYHAQAVERYTEKLRWYEERLIALEEVADDLKRRA